MYIQNMDNGFEILYIFDFKWNDKCIHLKPMIMYVFLFYVFFLFLSLLFLFLDIKIKQIKYSSKDL